MLVPREAGGTKFVWSWSYSSCERPDVGAGNSTHAICESQAISPTPRLHMEWQNLIIPLVHWLNTWFGQSRLNPKEHATIFIIGTHSRPTIRDVWWHFCNDIAQQWDSGFICCTTKQRLSRNKEAAVGIPLRGSLGGFSGYHSSVLKEGRTRKCHSFIQSRICRCDVSLVAIPTAETEQPRRCGLPHWLPWNHAGMRNWFL